MYWSMYDLLVDTRFYRVKFITSKRFARVHTLIFKKVSALIEKENRIHVNTVLNIR